MLIMLTFLPVYIHSAWRTDVPNVFTDQNSSKSSFDTRKIRQLTYKLPTFDPKRKSNISMHVNHQNSLPKIQPTFLAPPPCSTGALDHGPGSAQREAPLPTWRRGWSKHQADLGEKGDAASLRRCGEVSGDNPLSMMIEYFGWILLSSEWWPMNPWIIPLNGRSFQASGWWIFVFFKSKFLQNSPVTSVTSVPSVPS